MAVTEIKTAAGVLQLSPAAARFFDRKKSAPYEIGMAIAYAADAMTEGGGFERHLQQGQSEWAPLSEAYEAQKGGGEMFVLTGATLKAITSDLKGGIISDVGAPSGEPPNKLQYSKNGIYVKVSGLAKGKPSMVIGFEGKFKKNPLKKRGVKGARKHVAGGGFTSKGKGGGTSLAHANVIQAGEFKGLKSASGEEISVKDLNKLRSDVKSRAGARVVKSASRDLAKASRSSSRKLASARKRVARVKTKKAKARANESLAAAKSAAKTAIRGAKSALKQARRSNLRSRSLASSALGKWKGATAVHGTARPLLPATQDDAAIISAALERGAAEGMRNEGIEVR
jgi:hypothetical protein